MIQDGILPLVKGLTREEHWARFLEFSALEIATGGPDPHLDLAACGMLETDDLREKTWRAGCYVAPYEVVTGSVLWSHWSLQDVLATPDRLMPWIQSNWPGLRFRKERRASRTPQKLVESLHSMARWCEECLPLFVGPQVEYQTIWEAAINGLRFFGRYAVLKFLEALYRGKVIQVATPDIRPAGGWSPRLTLWLFYPEYPRESFVYNNRAVWITTVEQISQVVRGALAEHLGHPVSPFALEVLLCNYRQALEWRYPGHSHDATLAHYNKLISWWGTVEFPLFEYRHQLHPACLLGEVQGWAGPEKRLERTFVDHGYFWSDLLYDRRATTDLTFPVRRKWPVG